MPRPRLKRAQDLTSQPQPAPEAGDTDSEAPVDAEEARPTLPMCGSICPSAGSS